MDTPTLHEDHWRWRTDDGDETSSGASFHELEDVAHDFDSGASELDVNVRLRFAVHVEVATEEDFVVQLQYELNATGGFLDVNGASSVARSSASANLTDAGDTTEHGVTFVGSGSFHTDNDSVDEADGVAGGDPNDVAAQDFIAMEFCFQLREADLSDNDTILFRLVDNAGGGKAFDSVSSPLATATITIAGGATVINQVATQTLTLADFNVGLVRTFNQTAAGSLTLTPFGVQPVRTFNQTAAGSLTLTPFNVAINAVINIEQVATATLTLTKFNPVVSFGFNIDQVATATLTLTKFNATIVFDTIVNQVATATLTLAPFGVQLVRTFRQTATQTLTLTKADATIVFDAIVNQVAAGSLTLAPLNAAIVFDTIVNQPVVLTLSLTPLNAGVNAAIVIAQGAAGTLTLTKFNASVVVGGGGGTTINQTAAGTLTFTPNAATLVSGRIFEQVPTPALTLTPLDANLNLVWQNWGFLIDNMTWEGGKILKDVVRWPNPPGSPSTHHFYHAFFTGPDERSVRAIIRLTDGQDYLDFWFFHYWGHTGTAQVTWDKAKPPLDIFIDVFPFFRWGDGRPVRTSNWFATGFGMVDRIRLTLTGFKQGFAGPVTNSTKVGNLIPFFNHPDAPSFVGGEAASSARKEATLRDQISGMARFVTQDQREQFDSNTFRPAKPGQAAMQEHFGINALGVDVWAGGDDRESSWWHVSKKQMTSPANWVHPNSGDLVDFKSTAYNQLAIDQEGIDVNSRGWEGDPSKGQNWFNATKVDPNNPDGWPTREPVPDFERWRTFTQSHWAVTPLCQYYDRHKDPGIYQIILHIVETFIGAWPTESRGASHENVAGARGRGRGMESAVMLYEVTGDSRLIDSIQYRIPLTITSLNATPARNGNRAWQAARNDNEYSPWMAGIWGSGWLFAAQVDLPITAGEREQVIDTCVEVCQWVLETAVESSPGVWETPYKVEWTGSVWQDIATPGNNFTTWEWSLPLLFWVRAHHYSSLTAGEQTQVDEIYAVQVTNKTGVTNQWPESFEWVYEPAGHQATVAIDIPVPTVESDAEANPVGTTRIATVAIDIPVPTIVATATAKITGRVIMHIPVPTIRAVAFSFAPSVDVVGSVDINIPIPTVAVTASIPVKGVVAISIPVPSLAVTGTVVGELRSSTSYNANGTTTIFAIRVPYLSIDHIEVDVDGVVFVIGSPELSVGDAGLNIIFTDPPASGSTVTITRNTPHLPLVEFTCGAPVTTFGVTRMLTQILYVTEEADDLT